MWEIQLSELNYDAQENDAVARVLKSEWLTAGNETAAFEDEFTSFLGHPNTGVFVSSATAALHLILMSIGITSDDEVIMPALTFVSDANVVVQLGAKPVLADSVSIYDLNVDENSIISNITDRTKAIIVVHFAGFPMELSVLRDICDRKNIYLIEDCAHAPGASRAGVYSGTVGDFAFFSFFSNKNLAIGEGGMAFAKDKSHCDKIRLMRSHGMSAVTLDRHLGRAMNYDVKLVGLNYRPDEIRAALARVQLTKLRKGNKKRGELYNLYADLLPEFGINVPFLTRGEKIVPSFHIMPSILPAETDRSALMAKMKSYGIQTSVHYPSFKSFHAYRYMFTNIETPVCDMICARELTLPLHPRLELEHVKTVVDCMRSCI